MQYLADIVWGIFILHEDRLIHWSVLIIPWIVFHFTGNVWAIIFFIAYWIFFFLTDGNK